MNDIFMLCESNQNEKEILNFDNNRFKANIKYDGERVMCRKDEAGILLFNRRGNILNYKFPEIVSAFQKIDGTFMIDGEIIDFSNNFNLLSRRANTKDILKIPNLAKQIPCRFMAFDILIFNETFISNKTLKERLVYLNDLLKDKQSDNIKLVEYNDIAVMLDIAKATNGEGIVIKDMLSSYENKRSKSWIKHKLFKETTLTITGYTENPKGIRATDDKGNALQIAGFQSNEVKNLLETKGYAEINIQYLSQGSEGRYRFPSYRGLVVK